MLDSAAIRPDLTPSRACSAATPAECASGTAPAAIPAHRWQIECEDWTPRGPGSGPVVGICRLSLPAGLILADLRIVRTPAGLRISSAKRAVLVNDQPHRHRDGSLVLAPHVVSFTSERARESFSDAAIAAIRRSFPDALPDTAISAALASRHTAPAAASPNCRTTMTT